MSSQNLFAGGGILPRKALETSSLDGDGASNLGVPSNTDRPTDGLPLPATEFERRSLNLLKGAATFAKIVNLLMRSPQHKHYLLSDLEWLVLPPLAHGQYSLVEARQQGSPATLPVALALWATVSPEVDKRLEASLAPGTALRLRPDEWRSGDILWLIEAIGDQRVVPSMLQQLSQSVWEGRDVKVRLSRPAGEDPSDVAELKAPESGKFEFGA